MSDDEDGASSLLNTMPIRLLPRKRQQRIDCKHILTQNL